MRHWTNTAIKYITLFAIGALGYFECELNYRYIVGTLPVHWTMPVVGAFLFLAVGSINEFFPWEMPLLIQCFIGAVAITATEFVAGLILNVWLGMGIWDYSAIPGNVMGQICIPFAVAWFALSGVAIVLDDYMRYRLFGEEKPRYKIA